MEGVNLSVQALNWLQFSQISNDRFGLFILDINVYCHIVIGANNIGPSLKNVCSRSFG